MELQYNIVGWFEIPVENIDRAIKFYEEVFVIKLQKQHLGPLTMAFFPGKEGSTGAGGALVYHTEYYKPSRDGILIYFTALSGDAAVELSRIEKAGGKVLRHKTMIAPDIGYMGLFLDTEGNRIAIHSRQ